MWYVYDDVLYICIQLVMYSIVCCVDAVVYVMYVVMCLVSVCIYVVSYIRMYVYMY